jgi:hypothetical protein
MNVQKSKLKINVIYKKKYFSKIIGFASKRPVISKVDYWQTGKKQNFRSPQIHLATHNKNCLFIFGTYHGLRRLRINFDTYI